ncbi:MAG: hypothetical protein ACRDID_23230 [Ktedonobacterales bacterium]
MASVEREPAEQPVPFDQFLADAAAIFDEVAAGKRVVVQRDGQLVRLSPARPRAKRRPRHLTPDDPLWALVGAGDSGEPNNDVARDKYRYIADAIAAHSASSARPSHMDTGGAASDTGKATTTDPS